MECTVFVLVAFLSTPSARRATVKVGNIDILRIISIHALREEGDSALPVAGPECPPFLSTPSARRATKRRPAAQALPDSISIHALREEGDRSSFSERRFWDISIHALREEGDLCSTK